MKSRKSHALLIGTMAVILLLDQVTKRIAADVWQYAPWQPIQGIGFTYSENPGIAFGLPLGGVMVLVVTGLLIAGLGVIALRTQEHPLVMGLLLGGALGNFTDRLAFGVVRDFIQLGPWPTFNVADTAIVIGVGWWVWTLARKG